MNSKKVRDRTPEELQIRKEEFLKICDILDNHRLTYYLHGGVLLGAVREKGFIKWDWGVDIRVKSIELLENIDTLKKSLEKSDFKILDIRKKKDDLKIYFSGKYPKEISAYTIFGWNYSKTKDIYWREKYSIPSKFFNQHSTIDLFGREFKCPLNPEEYLTYAYGNWKVPLRTDDKVLYNSNKNFKIAFDEDIKEKIKKIYSIFKKK